MIKSHNNGGNVNVGLDRLVGQDAATVDVDLVANGNIVTENSHVLETGPAADGAVPANNRRLDPCVVLDLGRGQKDASLQTNAIADDDVRTNGDIGTYSAVLSDLGGGVNQDVASVDVRFRGRSELLASLLGERRQVQAGSAEEILGLSNIHPEALEVEGVQLVVSNHGGEGLLLNRSGAKLNAVQDGGIEDVHAGIDTVADELDGLLDEAVDARGMVGLVDNNTILGRLLHLGDHNGTLIAVALVEIQQLLEGIVADDIGVENEEGGVVLGEDALGELERTTGVEGLGLDRKLNVDVVFCLVLKGWTYAISLIYSTSLEGSGSRGAKDLCDKSQTRNVAMGVECRTHLC